MHFFYLFFMVSSIFICRKKSYVWTHWTTWTCWALTWSTPNTQKNLLLRKYCFFFVCMQSWIFFSSEGWHFLSVFMSSFKMVAITHFHSQVGTFTETKHRNWKFKIRDRIIKSYIQNTLTNFGMFQIFCLSKRDFKNFNVIILQFINLVGFNKII